MAEDLKKKQDEQLNEEQLSEVNGGWTKINLDADINQNPQTNCPLYTLHNQ